MSVPTPSTAPSMASSAPSPPEEPPAVCAADQGLSVRSQSGLQLSNASNVCGTFVLQITIAPAARRAATSFDHHKFEGRGEVVRGGGTHWCVLLGGFIGPLCIPDCAIEALDVDLTGHFHQFLGASRTKSETGDVLMSLRVTGTPWSSPLSFPVSANSASSLRASSLASSKSTEQHWKREF